MRSGGRWSSAEGRPRWAVLKRTGAALSVKEEKAGYNLFWFGFIVIIVTRSAARAAALSLEGRAVHPG